MSPNLYPSWKKKFLITIGQSYKNAPNFEESFQLVQNIFNSPAETISELAIESICQTANYLNQDTVSEKSSEKHSFSKGLEKAERLVAICRQKNADIYVNPSSGKELYDKGWFSDQGIELRFINNSIPTYSQYNQPFIPGLSIIDVLMFNKKTDVIDMLNQYTLS